MKKSLIALALFASVSCPHAATMDVSKGYAYAGGKLTPSSAAATYKAATTSASIHIEILRSVPTLMKTALGTATINVIDHLKANKPPLVALTKSLIKGSVSGIAGTILLDYLIAKGYEYNEEMKQYLLPVSYDAAILNQTGFICSFGSDGFPMTPAKCWARVGNSSSGITFRWELSTNLIYRYYFKHSLENGGGEGLVGYFSKKPTINDLPKIPATEYDIDNASKGFVDNHPNEAIAQNPVVDLAPGSQSLIPPYTLPAMTPTLTTGVDAHGNPTVTTVGTTGVVHMPPVALVPAGLPLVPTVTGTTTTTTTTTPTDGSPPTTTPPTTTVKPEIPPLDLDVPGTPSIPRFYTTKGQTVQSVWQAYKSRVAGAPVMTATNGFFSVSTGGQCPAWSQQVYGLEFTIDQFCSPVADSMFSFMRAVLMVLAAFFAFRIAVE